VAAFAGPRPLAGDAASSQAYGVRRPLFLTGMMGCGKTTVGRVLARVQGVPLVDLDERIERLFGATVPELVAARGEPGFREAEARALASLLAEPGFAERGVVVALGGGAVLHAGSREAIDRAGTRIYLEVGVDELVRRLRPQHEADPAARPLLQHGSSLRLRVAELLAARGSVYRAGALCIDAHDDPAAVAARTVAAVAAVATHADPGAAASDDDPGRAAPVVGSEAV
jgi:shikimate kinase